MNDTVKPECHLCGLEEDDCDCDPRRCGDCHEKLEEDCNCDWCETCQAQLQSCHCY
ncbi:MAG: hypothetical protein ACI88H_001418 [Cocleimonas sp.]|jgi:hypothetical protein